MERRCEECDDDDPRRELYCRIRELTKTILREYYAKYPERIGDQRMQQALDHSYFGLDLIITLIDEYDVGRKGRLCLTPDQLLFVTSLCDTLDEVAAEQLRKIIGRFSTTG